MPVPDGPPLATPALLSAILEDPRDLMELPPGLDVEMNELEEGDVLGTLYYLVLRPDVMDATYEAEGREFGNGAKDAREFRYLRHIYGRIAPVGFFWRMYIADVFNGGHDQYFSNHLNGAEPDNTSFALLIDTIEELGFDELPGGVPIIGHLRDARDAFAGRRQGLFGIARRMVGRSRFDRLDDGLDDLMGGEWDGRSPGQIWDRHVNAQLREIIRQADRQNLLAPIYTSWDALPPPTERQVYEK